MTSRADRLAEIERWEVALTGQPGLWTDIAWLIAQVREPDNKLANWRGLEQDFCGLTDNPDDSDRFHTWEWLRLNGWDLR